ncbi:hypothetical protein [Polaribacter marinivivus]|uniref:Riboflavin synthase subunit beta n=1 Tax=Polaribacter marinivivus TaxID=1524260 RepID=A0ABV8R4P4_9FLAO
MSFTAHMIASLKHNKRERVSAFKKMKDFKEGKNIEVYFDKKVTKYQLKKIRDKIQQENKYRLRKNIIIFTIAMLILIYAIGFVKF